MQNDPDTIISLIVAMSDNGVIGLNNGMPWHVPGDLKRFKELTSGKPVIMGRKTYDSIVARNGKPLPGRTNIVISRSAPKVAAGVLVYDDLDAAIHKAQDIAHAEGHNEIFIIGGAQIYAMSLLCANRIYMTKIHRHYKGDAYFPYIDVNEWQKLSKETVDGDPSYSFITLERS